MSDLHSAVNLSFSASVGGSQEYMCHGGEVEMKAKPGWSRGDVILYKKKKRFMFITVDSTH